MGTKKDYEVAYIPLDEIMKNEHLDDKQKLELIRSIIDRVLNNTQSKKSPRSEIIGILKNKVWMSDDFNEPLEEFEEYM